MKFAAYLLCAGAALAARGQTAGTLPSVTVYSDRVAIQTPAVTYAMPVSALHFEPVVDIQSRNMAEGQADVTIRGGIFENTGFQVGAISLLDPQTGHYLAEIPIAPRMLTQPGILTGADLAFGSTNATAGAIDYQWAPVRNAGMANLAAGEYGLFRSEYYQGVVRELALGGRRLAADVAVANSRSEGSIPFGEHRFNRVNGRLQLAREDVQTDLFAGYQEKFFGWPNLYTPFNSNETEDIETALFALNHHARLGAGEFLEAGAFYRRNKDDYAFNRFAPVGPVHPFQHTTKIFGGAIAGRRDAGSVFLNFRGELLSDELTSTSLTAGRYATRTLAKLSLVPESSWRTTNGNGITLKTGLTYDYSSRNSSEVSPVFEIAHERTTGSPRLHLSYSRVTQVPTYTALNSSATAGLFRGNPDLGRSRSHNVEVGANGPIAGWDAQSAIFWRRDDALVDWTFRRGVTARTANAVDITTMGFETVIRRGWSLVDVVLGYTMLAKTADYGGRLVDASFYALNYARHRLTAAITLRLGSGFELRLDNAARIQKENILRVTGGDQTVASSAALAWRVPSLRGLEFSAQVENLWDSQFQEVPAVPAARRQLSFGARYAW